MLFDARFPTKKKMSSFNRTACPSTARASRPVGTKESALSKYEYAYNRIYVVLLCGASEGNDLKQAEPKHPVSSERLFVFQSLRYPPAGSFIMSAPYKEGTFCTY